MIMKCESLTEVRNSIDRIDEQIVKLIAERGRYVSQAANFKKNSDDVKAPERVEEVINKVRILANECGINSDIVENIYREMINSFINFELFEHEKSRQKEEI